MINFASNRRKLILDSLTELNEKIDSNYSLTSHQKNEIEKTELLITQYQECLSSQNNVLNVLISEKERLDREKATYIKLLKETEYKESTFGGQDMLVADVEMINDDTLKPVSFDEGYEIVKSIKSLKYYRGITEQLSRYNQLREINYINQTVIPNKLKSSTVSRRMLLYRIDNVGEYPLEEIIGQSVTMPIDMHVSMGSAELLSLRGENQHTQYHVTPIMSCKSFSIEQCQTVGTRFALLVDMAPLKMALDIHLPEKDLCVPLDKFPEPEGYIFEIPADIYHDEFSFLRKQLSLQEVRERLIFVDASFARNVHDELVPIALTVLDYHAKILINTIICPRTIIKEYCESKHGLVEKDLLGTPDSQDIMKYFYNIIWDKIIVGHDLQDKFRHLDIDLKYLCGVRDLGSFHYLRKVLKSQRKIVRLEDIAYRILKHSPERSVSTAEQNAYLIRNIYVAVESQWRDRSFSPKHGTGYPGSEQGAASSRWTALPGTSANTENGASKFIRI